MQISEVYDVVCFCQQCVSTTLPHVSSLSDGPRLQDSLRLRPSSDTPVSEGAAGRERERHVAMATARCDLTCVVLNRKRRRAMKANATTAAGTASVSRRTWRRPALPERFGFRLYVTKQDPVFKVLNNIL